MKIDCQNLPCPEPVIKTKKALENLKENEDLEVLLNTIASIENVKRFATSQGFEVSEKSENGLSILSIKRSQACSFSFEKEGKTILIKDDKLGDGKLGYNLMKAFLASMCECEVRPKEIFLVNKAVHLACTCEESIGSLKTLERLGTKIYSCGICLEHLDLEIKVGKVGNAFETVDALLKSKGALSL